MFTSNQQRCLHELGILPLALRDKGENVAASPTQASDINKAESKAANTVLVDTGPVQKIACQPTKSRPSLASLLQSNEKPSVKSTTAASQVLRVQENQESKSTQQEADAFDWHQAAPNVLQDLAVLFSELKVNGDTLQLSQSKSWRAGHNVTDLQFDATTMTTPAVSKLSAQQKAQIWRWLSQS